MKRIIMFLLLFAALKVAGQTTGYLRFDTVKIMKQNGSCELYVINKTKDSLGLLTNVGGGLTQFKKSRVLSDTTFVVGNDTLKIIGRPGSGGGSGLNVYNTDSTLASDRTILQAGRYLRFSDGIDYTQFNGALQTIQPDSSGSYHIIKVINPPFAGAPSDGMVSWYEGIGFNAQAPSRPNYPYMQGWNLAPGGGAMVAGVPAIGRSYEPHYLPDPGSPTLWLMEIHDFFIQSNGTQKRLASWTINTRDNDWNVYYTTPAWSIRDTTSTDYLFATTASSTDRTSTLTLKSGNGATEMQFVANGTANMATLNSISAGQFKFVGFTDIDFGNSNTYSVSTNQWGIENMYQNTNLIRNSQTTSAFNFKNSNAGGAEAAFIINGNTGEFRNFVGAGGYFPTFYSNNAEAMRISTAGRLLVGTTTDDGATKLQVNGDATVTDEAYDATNWDGSLEVPTKNAIRDKIESMGTGITSINSQSGPAITISGQGAIVINSPSANNIGIAVDVTSDLLPRTIDALITTAQNTGTSETDLFTKTVASGTLNTDKQTLNFEADGEFNDNTATATLKLYFAGNVTLNTGAVNISTALTAWRLKGYIIRTSSSTAHVTYELHCPGLAVPVFVGYTNLTGLDFTSTNVFKITAQAGGAGGGTGDITAHSWQLLYKPQPQ